MTNEHGIAVTGIGGSKLSTWQRMLFFHLQDTTAWSSVFSTADVAELHRSHLKIENKTIICFMSLLNIWQEMQEN